jgi:uncharacterized membrane protein
MKRFPRYSLLTWIEAIVNMAHPGAALLALVFLILGFGLLAWFSTVAKVFLVLSLILITVQIVSRIRFIRTLRIIRHVQGQIEIFDRPSNKWLPGSRIKRIAKREFSHADPWRPLTVGFPGIEIQFEGVIKPVALLYPYGLEDERDKMYLYLRKSTPAYESRQTINESKRPLSKTPQSAPHSARPDSSNVVQKGSIEIAAGAIIFSVCCALGIIFLSIWLGDLWILCALFGVFLAFFYHTPAPNMIAGGIVILGSIVLGVAGMFLSKPLALISTSFFFIWIINSALTGVTVMNLQEKNKDAEQSN